MAHPLQPGSPWGLAPPPPDLRVPEGAAGLEHLAKQGRWREVVQRCRALLVAAGGSAAATPTAATAATYELYSLLKLRMLDATAAELARLEPLLQDGSSPLLQDGSSVQAPFALRVLRCELPWRQGRHAESIDRLFALLEWSAAQEVAAAAGAGEAAAALWQRRHRGVLLLLVGKHCRLRQYTAGLRLLNILLRRDPADAHAWMEAGTVQAMLGDLSAAQHTFAHAETLLLAPGGGGAGVDAAEQRRRQALVYRNRGLLLFLQHDHRGAKEAYEAAAAADPGGGAAAPANAALACLYAGRLGESIAALESAFQLHPSAMMQEAAVLSLASQYSLLRSPASLASKRRMADWVAAAAPDDFDLSCTLSGA